VIVPEQHSSGTLAALRFARMLSDDVQLSMYPGPDETERFKNGISGRRAYQNQISFSHLSDAVAYIGIL
jgi:hypothetical protein